MQAAKHVVGLTVRQARLPALKTAFTERGLLHSHMAVETPLQTYERLALYTPCHMACLVRSCQFRYTVIPKGIRKPMRMVWHMVLRMPDHTAIGIHAGLEPAGQDNQASMTNVIVSKLQPQIMSSDPPERVAETACTIARHIPARSKPFAQPRPP